MNSDEFIEKLDSYLNSPEGEQYIIDLQKKLDDAFIESRMKKNIPLHFSACQEEAMDALRDLYDDEAGAVISLYNSQQAEKRAEAGYPNPMLN